MSFRSVLVIVSCVSACDRAEPPKGPAPASGSSAPSSSAGSRKSMTQPPREIAPKALDAAAAPDSGAPVVDAGDAGSATDAGPTALVTPGLVGTDGKLFPQTDAEPSQQSPWFEAGVRALFRAIVADDPSLAEPFFFPLLAYEQVKDVKEPKRDWERRLMVNFRRDVHDYHKRLGPDAEQARFVGIDLPQDRTRWMRPRSEGNKLGYFRVTHSRLRYENAQGKPTSLEVTSLISWRGEWYLVHLNGFK